MNLKKKLREFFTLTRKADSGFTLVELIVVIAILAILAGIAVPAYSGYITQTNIAADQQLLADVKHALHLAFYADSNFEEGNVMISTTAAPVADNASLLDALKATFGEDLSGVRLKYDGWSSDYTQSSFFGNEEDLLAQVDLLTDTLQDAITSNSSLVGESFNKFLTDNGIDSTDTAAVADAAVLYVAKNTAALNDTQRQQYTAVLSDFPGYVARGENLKFIGDLTAVFGPKLSVTSATAIYAFTEAYFQFEAANGKTAGLEALRTGIQSANAPGTDQTDPLQNVLGAINDALLLANSDLAEKYFAGAPNSQAAKDGFAYLDIMDKVNSAQALFKENLGQEDAFSNAGADLFQAYVDGAVFVKAEVKDDGTLEVILPELDK